MKSKWTKFMDMNSGGRRKEEQAYIYIEAPEAEARVIFYNRFGHSPDRITCTCCGGDYSVTEYSSLEQATKFERAYANCVALDEYIKRKDVLVIYKKDIKKREREGDVPRQGYVWVD